MSTISKENYLKIIYNRELETGKPISTTFLANKLNVTKSAITDMARRLAAEDYINYERYHGIRMLPKGERLAVDIIRKHRLWELFLLEVLHLSWSEVHDEAELLEHTTSTGLINRIDKDTSGLVFVGKTNRGLWFYSKLFAERNIDKYYLAVVHGDFSKKVNENGYLKVSNYITRNQRNRKKYIVKKDKNAQLAITEFYLVAVDFQKKYSLVIAKPITGRTHQIRVHLKYLSFPIVGDIIYGKRDYIRLMLHSYMAKFPLLEKKKWHKVKAKYDENFKNFLKNYFDYEKVQKEFDRKIEKI